MSAHWLRPQCRRAPETGGSSVSVRPLWKQGVPSVGIKQQPPGEAHSESNSESVSAEVCLSEAPRQKQLWAWAWRPTLTNERSTGG